MSASIALRSATLPVRRQAASAGSSFSLVAALSKALQLSRLVSDTGAVSPRTVAKIRKQILAD